MWNQYKQIHPGWKRRSPNLSKQKAITAAECRGLVPRIILRSLHQFAHVLTDTTHPSPSCAWAFCHDKCVCIVYSSPLWVPSGPGIWHVDLRVTRGACASDLDTAVCKPQCAPAPCSGNFTFWGPTSLSSGTVYARQRIQWLRCDENSVKYCYRLYLHCYYFLCFVCAHVCVPSQVCLSMYVLMEASMSGAFFHQSPLYFIF